MKLMKFVVAAIMICAFSGAAMADVGDFRSTGETPRDGQLLCQRTADSAHKGRAPAAEAHQKAEKSADANSETAQ
jgi:hypothetical protein